MDILLKGLVEIINEVNTKKLIRDATNSKYYDASDDKIAQIKHFLETPSDLNRNLQINPRYIMEYQIGGLSCGRRALNNLLEQHIFEKDIGYEIQNLEVPLPSDAIGKKINLFSFCNLFKTKVDKISPSHLNESNYCREDENYGVDLIHGVLDYMGYINTMIDCSDEGIIEKPNIKGYIINVPGHWYAIVKRGTKYYELNSVGNKYYDEKTFSQFKREILDMNDTLQSFGTAGVHVIEVFEKSNFINPLTRIRRLH
jgi:hypothetical protein